MTEQEREEQEKDTDLMEQIDKYANFLASVGYTVVADECAYLESDMQKYPTDPQVPPAFVHIKEIIVGTQYDKDELLKAFKYLHDNRFIDTDYIAVNSLVHMYTAPDMIKIVPTITTAPMSSAEIPPPFEKNGDMFYSIHVPAVAYLWNSMDNWVYDKTVPVPGDFRLLEETHLEWNKWTKYVYARVLRPYSVCDGQYIVNFEVTNPATGFGADAFLLLHPHDIEGFNSNVEVRA